MMTIVDVIVGLFIVYIFMYKGKIKYKNTFIIGCSIVLLGSIFVDYNSFLCLLGKDGYKNSIVYQIDKIEDKIPTDKERYVRELKEQGKITQ